MAARLQRANPLLPFVTWWRYKMCAFTFCHLLSSFSWLQVAKCQAFSGLFKNARTPPLLSSPTLDNRNGNWVLVTCSANTAESLLELHHTQWVLTSGKNMEDWCVPLTPHEPQVWSIPTQPSNSLTEDRFEICNVSRYLSDVTSIQPEISFC